MIVLIEGQNHGLPSSREETIFDQFGREVKGSQPRKRKIKHDMNGRSGGREDYLQTGVSSTRSTVEAK
jgi:hypothetical protein